ncbi:MAG: hypothetical protein HYT80_03130 [Euryarchaeota archaeon]|nr:hypothetical protein [Euryarchaeota archaeon]
MPLAGFNLTDCGGATSFVPVPYRAADEAVPPAYHVNQYLPGIANVVIESLTCRKSAHQGVDGTAASAFFVSVMLDADNLNLENGWRPGFLIEAGTDLPALLAAMSARKIGVTNASHVFAVAPFPVAFEVVSGSARASAGGVLFAYEFRPPPFSRTVKQNSILFYGLDPTAGNLTMEGAGLDSSGDGAGNIQISGATKTRAITGDSPTMGMAGTRIHQRNIQLKGL